MRRGKETKPHIGIYGRRNNGKSSLINCLAGQDVAIVSDFAGTTTDPVKKSFEITGFAPVVLIDTAGIDDTGDLGNMRIEKSFETIPNVDLALLVISGNTYGEYENLLVDAFKKNKVPFLVIHNKSDIEPATEQTREYWIHNHEKSLFEFSTVDALNLDDLVKDIRRTIPERSYKSPSLVGDLVSYGDIVLLIVPIDIEAPAGRLILPQVQAIRDILDNDAVAIVLKEREVDAFLRKTDIRPALAITDSQIFTTADASIPKDVPLTSFSIVLARNKGNFEEYIEGTRHIGNLKDGDRVLMLESCSHHTSCDDIGRVKIPRWITNYTGKKLQFDVVAGLDKLPRSIKDYALVIQCGGCVITQKQLSGRLSPAIEAGIPVTNYGMAISYVQGIFNRAVAPFLPKTDDEADEYL
ncbi:MAG: [FeFe] hydrogenase H-cluster maturation GTPase HydF [Bacteroidales bacterium]|jgi:[FeFe] hydrogenase H-cluster maturation GTPase HydF|nr:[FeFe] hydrogenase H-cluster maturation GTPase HydF [Bacteroidales bacterium]